MKKNNGYNISSKKISPVIVIFVMFVTAIYAIGALSGCTTVQPSETTRSGLDETRLLIKRSVSDDVRAEKMIELVYKLESDLMAFYEKQASYDEAIVKKSADYDASNEDIKMSYDAYNNDARTILEKIVRVHLEMKKISTPEEWALISKPKHKIGGTL